MYNSVNKLEQAVEQTGHLQIILANQRIKSVCGHFTW